MGVNDVLPPHHNQRNDILFREVMGFANVPLLDKPLPIEIAKGAYNFLHSQKAASFEHSLPRRFLLYYN